MKKLCTILLAVSLFLALAACGGGAPAGADEASEPETTVDSDRADDAASLDGAATAPEENGTDELEETGGKVLVVVFSATGTTKGVAEKIATIEKAELYEIKAAEEYTSADLNWNDSGSRTTREQNDKSARPEIGSERISVEGYDKIYVGFPIWWGEEPRIMDTFAESYDFDGITMIPFCTSGSSGIGSSGENLAQRAGSGNWLEGKRFSGSVTEDELREWINSLQ